MWLGIASLLLANVISGGLNPIFVKIGVSEIPPLTFTAVRFILATIVFLPFYLRQEKLAKRENFAQLFLTSIPFTINVALFSIGIQFTTAIMSQVVYTLSPIIVALLAYFIFGERLTRHKVIGLIIAFSGLAFLLSQSVIKQELFSFGTPLGNTIMIMAMFSSSLFFILLQKTTKKYSSITTTFASFVVASIILVLISPIELYIRPLVLADITWKGIISLAGLVIFSSAIFWFLIQFGLKRTNAFTASISNYIAPFFTALSAIPILGEKVTTNLVVGGLLIIIGVFWATSYQYARKNLRSVLK